MLLWIGLVIAVLLVLDAKPLVDLIFYGLGQLLSRKERKLYEARRKMHRTVEVKDDLGDLTTAVWSRPDRD